MFENESREVFDTHFAPVKIQVLKRGKHGALGKDLPCEGAHFTFAEVKVKGRQYRQVVKAFTQLLTDQGATVMVIQSERKAVLRYVRTYVVSSSMY